MKNATRNILLNNLLPLIDTLIKGQVRGQIALDGKTSYGFAKMSKALRPIAREFMHWKDQCIKNFVETDEYCIPVLDEEGNYKFLDEKSKVNWSKTLSEYLNETIEIELWSFNSHNLENNCDNVPVKLIELLIELGCITDLEIVKK